MRTTKQLIDYLSSEAELNRRAHSLKLKKFSEREPDYYLFEDLGRWFGDPRNQALRVPMIAAAKGTSLVNRAIDQTAMVYDQPATRHVTGNDAGYQAVLEECNADDVARGIDRALLLYEDLLIVPRMVDGEMRLDLVTPDAFAAVPMVDDPRTLESIAVEVPARIGMTADDPRWRIYTKSDTYALNSKGEIVGAVEPNPLGDVWPVLFVSAQPAAVRGALMATCPSADLIAAETAQTLLTIFSLKEAKSSTRQLAISGDASMATMGQQADSESELFLPEGVSVSSIDRLIDLRQYMDLQTKVVDDCLAGRGIAPTVARLADASSGAAQWQRRIPLIEKRRQRLPLLRRIERKLWTLVARILEIVGDPRAFTMDGWTIDFVEPAEPLSEMESLQVFREKRSLFLQTTIDELARRNPDLGVDGAIEELRSIVEAETARVGLTQALQQMNGSTGSTAGDPLPHENGAIGAATSRPGGAIQ